MGQARRHGRGRVHRKRAFMANEESRVTRRPGAPKQRAVAVQQNLREYFLRICSRSLLAALMALASIVAHADEYPAKPITIIVPYAPGSGMDAMSRVIGQELGTRLKQTVVIDNKAGAN